MGQEDFPDDTDVDKPSGLRAQLEAALARAKAAETENATLKQQVGQVTVDSTFTKLGVPEKVRSLYNGEPTPEAIGKWVEDYKDVFGFETSTDEVDPETAEKADDLKRVQAASNAATGTGAEASKFAALDSLSAQPKVSEEDWLKALLATGGLRAGDIEVPVELD